MHGLQQDPPCNGKSFEATARFILVYILIMQIIQALEEYLRYRGSSSTTIRSTSPLELLYRLILEEPVPAPGWALKGFL